MFTETMEGASTKVKKLGIHRGPGGRIHNDPGRRVHKDPGGGSKGTLRVAQRRTWRVAPQTGVKNARLQMAAQSTFYPWLRCQVVLAKDY